MNNKLLLRLYRLKHASHDQSSHGRRGSGGGGSSVGVRGRKPKTPADMSGQPSMFGDEIADVTTPETTAESARVADFMKQPLNDMIAKIDASSLPEDKKAILRDIATKAAEASTAIHARRDELYTGNPPAYGVRYQMFNETYALSKPVVDAAHDAATDLRKEVRSRIQGNIDAVDAEYQASLINSRLNAQTMEYDALLVESTRLAVKQKTPASIIIDNELTGLNTVDINVADAVFTIADHTHLQPYDAQRVSMMIGDQVKMSAGVNYVSPLISESHFDPTANVVVVGTIERGQYWLTPSTGSVEYRGAVSASPELIKAVAVHEMGHWLEHNKHMTETVDGSFGPNRVDGTTATLKKLWEGTVFADDIDRSAGKNEPPFQGAGRAIEYANTIYVNPRKDGSLGVSGSEALSTTLEFLFGEEHKLRPEDSKMRSVVLTDKAVMQYTIGMLSY